MFDATYIINLDRSPERWEHAKRVAELAGFPGVQRFRGTDGASLSDADLRRLQHEKLLSSEALSFKATLFRGELGCALSHRLVLDEIIAKGWNSALILEDDVEVAGDPRDWRERLHAAHADLPEQWDIWYLYRCFDIEHRVTHISPRTVVPYMPQGCAAYAVSARGARKLRAATNSVSDAVDRVYMRLVRARKLRAFAASPLLIDPGKLPSIISEGLADRKWMEQGVNRPPEYWPVELLERIDEEIPAPARLRVRGLGPRIRRFLSNRLRRMVNHRRLTSN